jgi:putative ABC transport system permease protein
MIAGFGWVQGYSTYLYQALIDFETGNIQVLPKNYYENMARFPLDLTISSYKTTKNQIETHPGVDAVTGRIITSLEVIVGSKSVRMIGRGIDPEAEKNVTILPDYIASGKYLDRSGGLLMGKPMAERIGLSAGDTVILKAVDQEGVQNIIDVTLQGIFDFGYPALDDNVVYTDLANMQSLLAMENEVTKLVIAAKPGVDSSEVIPEIRKMLNEADGRYDVRVWRDFAQTTVSAVKGDSNTFWMMLIILYVLIIVGILNSMSMSIQERTGEIATMRAIGMKRRGVLGLFISEGISIALIASAGALILSIPVIFLLGSVGIDISQYMPEDLPIPFGERFYADFRVWQFLVSVGTALLTALAGSLIPSFRAMRINTAQALAGKK